MRSSFGPAAVGSRVGMRYGASMSDEPEPPEEPPWEVSQYEFEPPGWFEWLVAGSPGLFPPLILILGYLIWRWVAG